MTNEEIIIAFTFINIIVSALTVYVNRKYADKSTKMYELVKEHSFSIADISKKSVEELTKTILDAKEHTAKVLKDLGHEIAEDIAKSGEQAVKNILETIKQSLENRKKKMVSDSIQDIIKMHNIISSKDSSIPPLPPLPGIEDVKTILDAIKQKKNEELIDYCEKIPKTIKNETDYFYAKEVKNTISDIISKFEHKKFDECNKKEKSLRSAYEKVQHVISKYEDKKNKK